MRDLANLPSLLQSFFTTRLMTQRKASPHTIASYRDTFRLLLQFAQKRLRKAPSQLELENLDASLVDAFLEDLENRRRNGARSRNLRLTAIRSFFRYASVEAPAQSGIIQRVLAIPNQRQPRALVGFLTRPEIEALLAAPNRTNWLGRRDHAFLLTAVQTGLRLSEMTALRHEDVSLGAGAHVRCRGKGRKERCNPLAKPTVAVPASVDSGARQRRFQNAVPQCSGWAFKCRWCAALARTPRGASAEELRFAAKETSLTTCPAARRRHGTAASRRGSSSDCALARP
jgi:integrase/recombinase XerD